MGRTHDVTKRDASLGSEISPTAGVLGKGIDVAFIAGTREQVQSLYEHTTGTACNVEAVPGLALRVGR